MVINDLMELIKKSCLVITMKILLLLIQAIEKNMKQTR